MKPPDHAFLFDGTADLYKGAGRSAPHRSKICRTVEKECSVRRAEFEKVMQYHSERELQDDFGCGFRHRAQPVPASFSRGGRGEAPTTKTNWLCAWCAASWRILTQIAGSGSFVPSPGRSASGTGAGRAVAERVEAKNRGKRKHGIIEAGEDMEEG